MGFLGFRSSKERGSDSEPELLRYRRIKEYLEEYKERIYFYRSIRICIVELIEPDIRWFPRFGSVLFNKTKLKIRTSVQKDVWGDYYTRIIDPEELREIRDLLKENKEPK